MRLLRATLVSLFCLSTLIACGGGSGDVASSASEQTGQVTVLIGDKPTFEWDQVWITFSEIRFITRGGQDIHVLDEPRTLDLLALENYTERLVPARELVTGAINKVRFILSDIRLVKVDDSGTETEVYPRLPANGQIDLLLRGAEVRAGEKLVLEVDVVLRDSVRSNRRGDGEVTFRPVFTASASTEDLAPRLMRVEGDVDGLVDGRIKVCNIRSAAEDELNRPHQKDICILLETTSDTAFVKQFDDGADVLVQTLDHIVAYGLMDMDADDDTMVVEVIGVGNEFVRLKGDALTVAHSPFDLDVSKDDTPDPKEVGFADGAKVFDAEPKEVTAESIAVGNYLETEGFPPTVEGDPDVNAFIVLLNHEVLVVAGEPTPTTTVDLERLTGQITLYGTNLLYVDNVDCVMYDETTDIVEIVEGTDGVTVTQLTAPTNAAEPRYIDARGIRDACLMASSIVIDSVPFE
jgi:hypothetical protein